MISLKSLSFLTCIFTAAAQQICYASNTAGDGCIQCDPSEINGGSCVRNGQWLPCGNTVDDCCSTWPVSNTVPKAQCIEEYELGGIVPCNRFVGRTAATSNRECIADCEALRDLNIDPIHDPEFTSKCYSQFYRIVNNNVKTTHQCFDNWVYGYSSPKELSGYLVFEDIATPNECQLLCQSDEECLRWTWASSLAIDTSDKPHRCSLKNRAQVEGALAVKFNPDGTTDNLDSRFCQVTLEYVCRNNIYQCSQCHGSKTCVWHSAVHVNGWKHCPATDTCNPPDYSFTTPPPITTVPTLPSTTGTSQTETVTEPTTTHVQTMTTEVTTTTTEAATTVTEVPTILTSTPAIIVPPTTQPVAITQDECNCPIDESCLADVQGLGWQHQAEGAPSRSAEAVAGVGQGLVLAAAPISAHQLKIDNHLLPHIYAAAGSIPPVVVVHDAAFAPPTIVTSIDRGLSAPQFELGGEKFIPPLVFVGADAAPKFVVNNEEQHSVSYNIVVDPAVPVVIQIQGALQSVIPPAIVLTA